VSDDRLPTTGVNVPLLVGAALIITGAGLGLLLIARRRRTPRFTA
jgi:hypothetical protein